MDLPKEKRYDLNFMISNKKKETKKKLNEGNLNISIFSHNSLVRETVDIEPKIAATDFIPVVLKTHMQNCQNFDVDFRKLQIKKWV